MALLACLQGSGIDARGQNVIHTTHDHIPNFADRPTIQSAADGAWSAAATWKPARVPGPTDIVSVSHSVRYDSATGEADVVGIAAGGTLRFSPTETTRLKVSTLIVLPKGRLEIGTPEHPVVPTVTAEIVIRDKALDPATDPDQFGTGLLAIDGAVIMHGAVKSPSFARTSVEPLAKQTSVMLSEPVTGWRVGDRVFLPDTRQVPTNDWFNPKWALQVEERTIRDISQDGRTITFDAPLSFNHKGARDADGTPTVLGNGIRLLPHLGNLTRNVVIRSENPSGTRGHTLYTRRADVRMHYVQFQDLGRTRATPLNAKTNRIGRYPVHIHHLWGPPNPTNTGHQFVLLGNAVNDSLKWPIAVHASHFGLIKQNVVFGGSQLTGAGITTEDGSETENVFEENFVANIRGDINARQSGPDTADGFTPGSAAECYWAAGFNNRFINNVAASCRNPFQQIVAGPGFKFIVNAVSPPVRIPRVRGAEMTGGQTATVVPQNQPILEFRGNEVYGLAADGLTVWHLGTDGYRFNPNMAESVIKDFRVWHTYFGAIWNYPVNRVTIDGLVYRIDPNAGIVWWPSAVTSGDYRDVNLTVRGGSIHAGSVTKQMIDPLGTIRFESIDAVTREHAFQFETPATPGTQADRPPSGVTMILRNNQVRPWPGQPLRTIALIHTTENAKHQAGDKYEVFVHDYQGRSGVDFRVYFEVQATEPFYGGVASCSRSAPPTEIRGFTCPVSPPPPGSSKSSTVPIR